MISERDFSLHFSSFWRSALPNMEAVVRSINLSYDRIDDDITATSNSAERDMVSESGYQLFCFVLNDRIASPREYLAPSAKRAERFIHGTNSLSDAEIESFVARNSAEIIILANRIIKFCRSRSKDSRFSAPVAMTGHSLVGDCNADLLVENDLVEIKYVDRNFRSIDLRQCLIYTSLNYLKIGASFDNIVLFNPLRGIYVELTYEEVIRGAGGISLIDFIHDFSFAASSGQVSI
jgi:hypothetical protein